MKDINIGISEKDEALAYATLLVEMIPMRYNAQLEEYTLQLNVHGRGDLLLTTEGTELIKMSVTPEGMTVWFFPEASCEVMAWVMKNFLTTYAQGRYKDQNLSSDNIF